MCFGRTFTGAWIETIFNGDIRAIVPVAPLRVRGLKQDYILSLHHCYMVAPLRVRGLKLS